MRPTFFNTTFFLQTHRFVAMKKKTVFSIFIDCLLTPQCFRNLIRTYLSVHVFTYFKTDKGHKKFIFLVLFGIKNRKIITYPQFKTPFILAGITISIKPYFSEFLKCFWWLSREPFRAYRNVSVVVGFGIEKRHGNYVPLSFKEVFYVILQWDTNIVIKKLIWK